MNLFCRSLLLGFAASLASCTTSTEPDVASVAGTYVLQSVSGRGPAEGSIVLTRNGGAEQRFRYRLGTGSLSDEFIFDGYFSFTATGSLEIGLRQGTGSTPYVFKPIVTWSRGTLTLEYADPADGPNIIETYRRL